MLPSQAIEKTRQHLAGLLKPGQQSIFRYYVFQPPERQGIQQQTLPEQSDPWDFFAYGPSDNRPYYIVTVSGSVIGGIPKYESHVELFNRPDYARATIWDRLTGPSDPPSSG